MKKILILGATSELGKAISVIFSNSNHLILIGRDKEKLSKIASKCQKYDPNKIEYFYHDFSKESTLIPEENFKNIDVVINLISSTSRLADSKIVIESFISYIVTDLNNIFLMLTNQIIPNTKKIKIIHISSVIEEIRTPDRYLYSSIKTIFRVFLKALVKDRQNIDTLIVNIGTVIDHKNESKKANKIAKKILNSHSLGHLKLNIGISGAILKIIFNLNPMLANMTINFIRLFKIKEKK